MKKLALAALAACLLALPAYAHVEKGTADNIYGVNFLLNPGAEDPNPEDGVAHWQTVGSPVIKPAFTDTYGHTSGEWDWDCTEQCGLPAGHGKNYFRFQIDNSYPSYGLQQDVDLARLAPALAKEEVLFTLSAQVAGMACAQAGCAKSTLSIVFFDSAGQQLAAYEATRDSTEYKLVKPDDSRMMQFAPLAVSNQVPKGAVKARVAMGAATSDCCNGGSAFFDNLSLVFNRKQP